MQYNEKIFLAICQSMGLKLDPHPDYDAAIQRMKEFYPENKDSEDTSK